MTTAEVVETSGPVPGSSVLDRAWQVHPKVAVRPEPFGALLYHFGTRRLSFLKNRTVVAIVRALPENEFIGDLVRDKLLYYPTVTREPFRNQGRITDLLESGRLAEHFGLLPLDPERDRLMLCGSPALLADLTALLDARGFEEGSHSKPGHYVIEKAFVEK